MALGADTFVELVVSTLENIGKDKLYDNVFTRHPVLELLKSEQRSATGRKHVINLELGEDSSTTWTDDSGTFSQAVSADILGAAVYDWSDPLVSSVRLKWKQLKMNQGKEQIVDLLKKHINNMQKSHARRLALALHKRAADVEAGQFLSLDQLVSDADYDTTHSIECGGIDSSSQDLWVATRREATSDDQDAEYLTVRQAMRRLANDIFVATNSMSAPDHFICGRTLFEEFEDSFDDKVRYIEYGEGQTKFTAVKFGDLEVRLDPDSPPLRGYMLTKDSFEMKSLAGTFMETQETQSIQGTLDKVTPVASVVSVGVNERRANGVLLRPTTAGGDA